MLSVTVPKELLIYKYCKNLQHGRRTLQHGRRTLQHGRRTLQHDGEP